MALYRRLVAELGEPYPRWWKGGRIVEDTRAVEVRGPDDDEELLRLRNRVRSTWGDVVARCDEVVDPADGELLGAYVDHEIIGVASYAIRADECEVVAIEAYQPRHGIATGLMDEIRARATAAGCRRLWLVTTNDNVPAIGFYQRWGMDLAELRRDAATRARAQLKPEIPATGHEDIPIRHELEFELLL
jgi:GNAT superfamily N-acetyltransferase